VKLAQHLGHERVESVKQQLAFMLANDPTLRVDEHQGWLGPAAEQVPNLKVPVVDDGVFDAIAEHRRARQAGAAG